MNSFNSPTSSNRKPLSSRNSMMMTPTKSSAMLVLNTQKSFNNSSNPSQFYPPENTPKKQSLESITDSQSSQKINSNIQNSNPLVQPKINIVTDVKMIPKVACYSSNVPCHYTEQINWDAYKHVKTKTNQNDNFPQDKYIYNTPIKHSNRGVNSNSDSKNVEDWRVEKNDKRNSLGGDTFENLAFSSPLSEKKIGGNILSGEPPINLVGTSFIYQPSPSHNLPGANGGPGPGFGFSTPIKGYSHVPSPSHRSQPLFPSSRPEQVSMQLQIPGIVREELSPGFASPELANKLAQKFGSSPIPNPTFRTAGGQLAPTAELRRVINKKNVPVGAPKLLPGESIELLKQREKEKEAKMLKKIQEEEEAIARLNGLSQWNSPIKQSSELVVAKNSESQENEEGTGEEDNNLTYADSYPISSKDEAALVIVSEEIPQVVLNESWSKCWDHEAESAYYYNYLTGEATWTLPDNL